MDALEVGTTLMRKYRLDRFAGEHDGTAVYDATDIANGRLVQVRLGSPGGATVIDIGALHGRTYVVTADDAVRFPAPTAPVHLASVTRTLPGLGTPPRLEVVEMEEPPEAWEEEFFESEPIAEYENPPIKKRRWSWVALPLAGVISALVGFYLARTERAPVSVATITAAELPAPAPLPTTELPQAAPVVLSPPRPAETMTPPPAPRKQAVMRPNTAPKKAPVDDSPLTL